MKYRYWDANCFLSWLNEDEDRVPLLLPVIREAEAGNLRVVTSALTIGEVLYLKRSNLPTREQAARIERFFEQEWIIISTIDRDLMAMARRIVWESGIHAKDAIHVASALDANAEHFDTFDTELIERAKNYPLVVGPPNLPDQLDLLPPNG